MNLSFHEFDELIDVITLQIYSLNVLSPHPTMTIKPSALILFANLIAIGPPSLPPAI